MARSAPLLALLLTSLGCGSNDGAADSSTGAPEASVRPPSTPAKFVRPLHGRPQASRGAPVASDEAPATKAPELLLTLSGHAADVVPTTEADGAFLEAHCGAFVQAIGKAEDEATSLKERTEEALLEKARAALPKGPDGDRCIDVHRRTVDEYLASKVEGEAVEVLGAIAKGLQAAFDAGKVCPAAGPTPKVMASQGDKWVGPEEYATDAWRCIGFSRTEPQYYQYEVKTDAAAKRFEIIARGYPLRKKGKLSELVFAEPFREKGDPAWDTTIVRR